MNESGVFKNAPHPSNFATGRSKAVVLMLFIFVWLSSSLLRVIFTFMSFSSLALLFRLIFFNVYNIRHYLFSLPLDAISLEGYDLCLWLFLSITFITCGFCQQQLI